MAQQSSGKKLKIEDIYCVRFRRKWVLLAFCFCGLFTAAVTYKNSEKPYSSQAELLVRFVMDSGAAAVLLPGSEDQIRSPNAYGESILNNETAILTSLDLAKEVARVMGPERILKADASGPKAEESAARVIVGGLEVSVAYRASVLNVVFSHSDPRVAQEVLEELLRCYQKRHAEIHLKGADYELLAKQTEELRVRLQQTEQEVNLIRSEVGGVSLEESKAALSKELATIRSAILDTQVQLAAANPALSPNIPLPEASAEIMEFSTNAEPATGYEATALRLSSEALLARARALRAREQDYLSRFTENNPLVKSVRLQIAEVDYHLAGLAVTNPEIVLGELDADSTLALRARLNVLTNQLQVALEEANRLSRLEYSLTEVLRRKNIQEQNYQHLATSLERERFDTALEFSKLSNIVVNQEPSPPLKNAEAAQKQALTILAGVVGGGFALVFLFELFIDPRLKRASQIEQNLSLPLYVSIPRLRRNGVRVVSRGLRADRQLQASEKELPDPSSQPERNGGNGELRSYCEALRDRIVVYFERVNLRRKPKLVGLAGCHHGAGVSTIAQGLAETLSETGGGKVLLVDLNGGAETAHPYFKGKPSIELNDALEHSDNGNGDSSKPVLLASLGHSQRDYHPVRTREFDQLIPRLKASDFDYIVFDMPPLHATSVSYRLSGLLDKMLLVAESERTQLETLKKATSRLEDSNARVATVLNKQREYLPRWLQQPL